MPLSSALDAWRGALGSDHVTTDGGVLDMASRATFPTEHRLEAVLRPGSREEVQACVRIAAQEKVRLYPVSTGKNWGFGSKAPTDADSVLLDLGRLNRIVELNEELAYVTVEPGVTFQQVYDLLVQRKARLFLNTTGASPHSSVVGNALERGDGTGPLGDRVAHVCALEVVLGTGEIVRTGFSRFDGTALGPLHRWGVGPSLDGLFSQSSLGVVTRMTCWLSPLPRSLHVVHFGITSPARVGKLVDALRELRLDGTLRSVVGLWNDHRTLSTQASHPNPGRRTPLSRAEVHEQLGSSLTWYGRTAIYAPTPMIGHAQRVHLEQSLERLVDELRITEASGDARAGHELILPTEPALRFLQGIPHEGSLRSLYFARGEVPEQIRPEEDDVGALWLAPAVPFRGRDVARAVALAEDELAAFGFQPMVAVVGQSERCMYLVPLLIYDRKQAGADERALSCHDSLLGKLSAQGYLPYRLGLQSMNAALPSNDDSPSLQQRLKRACDPESILAPGRYPPGSSGSND